MAGFIIGFDGESKGAGARIVDFIEHNNIPLATFSMLQALPGTALWQRLEKEGRLRSEEVLLNQTSLTNFVPTRPIEEIATEYVNSFYDLYDPRKYLDRTYRHFLTLSAADVYTNPARHKNKAAKPKNPRLPRVLLTVIWRQGILRKTRWVFWFYLWQIYRRNREGFGGFLAYTIYIEHFMPYREVVKRQIEAKLATLIESERLTTEKPSGPVEPKGHTVDRDEIAIRFQEQ
jgi:radical SAM superfamily enzyme YgiQ (UPF0313 family)